jgi:hypothetical protein
VQPKISYASNNQSRNPNYEPRNSLSIDQIDHNLKNSKEFGGRNETHVKHQLTKMAPSKMGQENIQLFDKQTKQSTGKSVNAQSINQLLSQKAFVKQMLKKNPEFLENVVGEVKEQVREEVKGRND